MLNERVKIFVFNPTRNKKRGCSINPLLFLIFIFYVFNNEMGVKSVGNAIFANVSRYNPTRKRLYSVCVQTYYDIVFDILLYT